MPDMRKRGREEMNFTVIGTPVGKSRPKFSTVNGHAVAYTPQKTANYETLVKLSYQQQCGDCKPFDKDVPLTAVIHAYFPIPKSVSKRKREIMSGGLFPHTKKPDTDNLAKCVLDALNGIAYQDDSQIVALRVTKYYAEEPHVDVEIYELA